MKIRNCDLLVIGAGLSGLRAALRAALSGFKVIILSKGCGASPGVLGFNAVFHSGKQQDSAELLKKDMCAAGGDLNDPGVLEAFAAGEEKLLGELEEEGYRPERGAGGEYLRRHLGGNSVPRSFFSSDRTGAAIRESLLKKLSFAGAEMLCGEATAPVMREGRCIGAFFRGEGGGLSCILADCTLAAAGGIGRLVEGSTYPEDVDGFSAAFCLLAGAELINMEFLQFEPTVCFDRPGIAGMEMPTAMLGDGAVLRNAEGRRFILDSGVLSEAGMEKAKMALLIAREIREGRGKNGGVFFDASALPEEVRGKYALRAERLRKAGYDLSKDLIPVRPAPHSHMGGVRIGSDCSTAVPGLFCCGEAEGSLQGASRIAGSGGGEALVTGGMAGQAVTDLLKMLRNETAVKRLSSGQAEAAVLESLSEWAAFPAPCPETLKRIPRILAEGIPIIRDASSMRTALDELEELKKETGPASDGPDRGVLRFAKLLCAESMLRAALRREESRGAHYRSDFPLRSEAWNRCIVFRLIGTALAMSF